MEEEVTNGSSLNDNNNSKIKYPSLMKLIFLWRGGEEEEEKEYLSKQ